MQVQSIYGNKESHIIPTIVTLFLFVAFILVIANAGLYLEQYGDEHYATGYAVDAKSSMHCDTVAVKDGNLPNIKSLCFDIDYEIKVNNSWCPVTSDDYEKYTNGENKMDYRFVSGKYSGIEYCKHAWF